MWCCTMWCFTVANLLLLRHCSGCHWRPNIQTPRRINFEMLHLLAINARTYKSNASTCSCGTSQPGNRAINTDLYSIISCHNRCCCKWTGAPCTKAMHVAVGRLYEQCSSWSMSKCAKQFVMFTGVESEYQSPECRYTNIKVHQH